MVNFSAMLDYRAKIAALDEYQLSPDEMRSRVASGEISPELAEQWTTKRLLAWKIGEARTVLSTLVLDDQDAWEYKTALKNGNLGMGISLHGIYRGLHSKSGQPVEISADEYRDCGQCCVLEGDWHNAIAAFERGKNKDDLLDLVEYLQHSDDSLKQEYAALARTIADLIG